MQILMNNLASNMRKRMKELGLTQKELAERADISQVMVHKLVSGKTEKTTKLLEIADALQCKAEWLKNGVSSEFESLKGDNFELGPRVKKSVPLISWVRAGMWEEISSFLPLEGEAEEWRETTGNVSNSAFALRVKGDSMTNPYGAPSIPEGSIIIVDPCAEFYSGKIVVAKLIDSNEATLKRLVIDGSQKFLVPLNPRYPTLSINGNCEIVGVVIKIEYDL